MNLKQRLEILHQKSSWRTRACITRQDAANVIWNGKKHTNLASNDYLNLSQHPKVKHVFSQAAQQYGLGSTASPLVCGFSDAHRKLEEAFSEFLERKALLFNSGFHANLAIFDVLADRHTAIFSDKYCHASLLDGIRLSRASHQRFAHHNLNQLATLLSANPASKKIIVTESIFSMGGDITRLDSMVDLAQKEHTLLFVDDAHGLGVLGEQGKGAIEHFKLPQKDVFCLNQPLGKALGSIGAIVSGEPSIIEMLIQKGRAYGYSTALPPAVAEATFTSLTCLKKESWRRHKLHDNIAFFNQTAKKLEIPLISWDNTPIRSVFMGSNDRALACQHFLRECGYFVVCIRPPTVPEGSARLRLSLSSELEFSSISRLLFHLSDFLCQEPV